MNTVVNHTLPSNIATGIILLAFIPLSICSCDNINIKKELKAIDSLNQVIGKADIKIKDIDVEKVKKCQEEVIANLNIIEEYYQDTLPRELIKLLSDYNSIKKPLKRFLDNKEYYDKEIVYSKKQLQNLKQDIEKRLITKEQFQEYYSTEMKAVSDLERDINLYVNTAKTKIDWFNSTNPKIREVIEKNGNVFVGINSKVRS